MAEVEVPKNVFTFTWSIRNFFFCVREQRDSVDSPKFELEFIKGNKFYLRIHRGQDILLFRSLYLCKEKKCDNVVMFKLEVRLAEGQFLEISRDVREFFGNNLCCEVNLDRYKTLQFEKERQKINLDDTLTLRCQLWMENYSLPVSIMCYAHTRLNMLKFSYIWTVNDIFWCNNHKCNLTEKVPHFLSKVQNLEISLINSTHGCISFAIQNLIVKENIFMACRINLLDVEKKAFYSVTDQRWLIKSTSQQFIELSCPSKYKLLSNCELYVPQGKLTIQCEFSISTIVFDVEEIRYGKIGEVQLEPPSSDLVPDSLTKIKQQGEAFRKEIMEKFFKEGKFSDVVIQAPKQKFHVHKCVLAAHSEVFCAMLESDMKEQRSGVIDIEDLEDETVDKMLSYLYTGTVEGMDSSVAQKLYFAADKYEIKPLLKLCSYYLMTHLDVSTVCNVLVLSDTHQDQELKQRATDYIVEHDVEIVDSENWAKIMETHAHLTSVTMKQIVCKYQKSHK